MKNKLKGILTEEQYKQHKKDVWNYMKPLYVIGAIGFIIMFSILNFLIK